MELTLTHPEHDAWSPRLTHLVERYATDLRHRLTRHGLDGQLAVDVRTADDGQAEVKVRLELPGEALIAHDRFDDAGAALRTTFEALFREFDRYRIARDAALRARIKARAEARKRAESERIWARQGKPTVDTLLREQIVPPLLRVAHHQLVIRQFEGDLEPGWLDPEDIVDDVLADFIAKITPEAKVPALIEALEDLVVAHVAEVAAERVDAAQRLSIDAGQPRVEPELYVSDLGADILDFWVVDERLKLADLLEDEGAIDPEALVGDREARHLLIQALYRLDEDQRRDFERVVIDGFHATEVAETRGCEVSEVDRRVALASARLSAYVGAAGLDPDKVQSIYREMGRRLQQLGSLGPV